MHFQSLNFSLEKETMDILDSLHNDRRFVELDRINKSLSNNQPDGYKIRDTPSSTFPAKLSSTVSKTTNYSSLQCSMKIRPTEKLGKRS